QVLDLQVALEYPGIPLTVRSDPPGAVLLVDGKAIAKTPVETTVSAKSSVLKIELKKDGFEPFAQFVAVGKQPIEISHRLEVKAAPAAGARRGYVTLEADMLAIVYINEKRLDRTTPIRDYALPEGNYIVRFESPATKKKRVEKLHVRANQHQRLRVKLR